MPSESWTLLGSCEVSSHRIFRIRNDRYRFEPTAAERDFVVLDSPDWVNVVPITDDGKLVLVRQYRHGIRRNSLEVPGGLVDPGESPEAAAVRELEEETGYAPGHVRSLGRISPNPAIQNNYCHMYLAEGCRRVAQPRLDPFERIDLVLASPGDLPGLIQSEEICHSLAINSLTLAGLFRPAP